MLELGIGLIIGFVVGNVTMFFAVVYLYNEGRL